ncbi:MAG: Ribonuclease HIII [Verrucomicrobia subdivision 3 bacterium]|nr:Ribonuclease HIII [Limisphaerales bacterium]MCS1416379.1 Ribonuclease HIII [Limisphaerales bacterium]
MPAKEITTYTRKLTNEQGHRLAQILEKKGYSFSQMAYAKFAARHEKVNVVFYESGKLVVQGKGAQDFVQFILEPDAIKEVQFGYEDLLNPDRLIPRYGIDESGKGDFFGPLCVAGVYVNESVVKTFEAAGIQDSKNISSDKRIVAFAEIITKTPGCVHTTVPIGPEAYNRLHREIKSVNRLLAWGHARVIENLMGQRHRMDPLPKIAISDQFASSKTVTEGAIMAMGKEIKLIQRHKAEADIAVAAASILARCEFVRRLRKLEKQYGLPLPKGAAKAVDAAAKEFLQRHGEAEFGKVGKLHFRTAYRALGQPEPPRAYVRQRRY